MVWERLEGLLERDFRGLRGWWSGWGGGLGVLGRGCCGNDIRLPPGGIPPLFVLGRRGEFYIINGGTKIEQKERQDIFVSITMIFE